MSTVICVFLLQFLIFAGSLYVRQVIWNVSIHQQLVASWTTLFIVFGNNLIYGPLGEEPGWRGFVQNELQKRFSPLKSAMIYKLNQSLVIPILIHQLFNYLMAIQMGDRLQILIVTTLFYFIVALALVLTSSVAKSRW
ncbi:type II CAAX prenyl endopeptidase Rce1 family protein [Paenibacillus sp. NPDC058177]|uniref:CPBP family glutamic-type intramembrane protease n=1 Tax=Paenibacillus sp. NPDC058177 TaxID=3346369 RepID=UPI0036D96E61